MYKAIWNDKTLAQSDKTIEVEGNQYFPKEDVNLEFFEKSDYHTTCPWKGFAHYYHVIADGKRNDNAAWYYPEPLEAATHITDYVAFWKGVKITED